METIKTYVTTNDKASLHALNQHNAWSAFFDVDFGGCKFGVFSAAMPIEALHSIENGIMNYVLRVLFDEKLSEKQNAALDRLVKKMVNWSRQFYLSAGTQKQMPALLWNSGISTITNTTANAKVGMVLTIFALSLTNEGNQFFNSSFKNNTTTSNMQYIFQMLL